jgi:hypothetical protein
MAPLVGSLSDFTRSSTPATVADVPIDISATPAIRALA